MNIRKTFTKKYRTDLHKLSFGTVVAAVAGSIMMIAIATLFPFNFAFNNGFSLQYITSRFHGSTNLSDFLINLLLFIPLGVSLACLMEKAKFRGIIVPIAVLSASFSLSFTVEILQVFVSSRQPSSTDILLNSASGLLGYLRFYLWRFQKS